MFVDQQVYSVGLANDGGGEHLDPFATDVLATTGAQGEGQYLCNVTIVATNLDDSKALFEIQHRNSDDDEIAIESLTVAVPVDDCKQFEVLFKLETDERITVVPSVDMLGTVKVAINWQEIA